MLVYLDTCIVIYAVEGQAPFQQRAQGHIAALEVTGDRFLISDLTRGECLVHPLGRGDAISHDELPEILPEPESFDKELDPLRSTTAPLASGASIATPADESTVWPIRSISPPPSNRAAIVS